MGVKKIFRFDGMRPGWDDRLYTWSLGFVLGALLVGLVFIPLPSTAHKFEKGDCSLMFVELHGDTGMTTRTWVCKDSQPTDNSMNPGRK